MQEMRLSVQISNVQYEIIFEFIFVWNKFSMVNIFTDLIFTDSEITDLP